MNKITSSVMCIDLMNIERDVLMLDAAGTDMFHIDVIDGHYTPNHCLCPDIVRGIRKLTDKTIDVHLMVTNPMEFIDMYSEAGADILILHVETLLHPVRAMRKIRSLGKKAGLAVSPATDIENFRYFIDELDVVCMMTVDPGFAGQNMIPGVLNKIRRLRDLADSVNKDLDIIADGQVKKDTAGRIVKAGANVLVLGSSGLFSYMPEEYASVIEDYRRLG